MYESYIAFDVNWRYIGVLLSILFPLYLLSHIINYNLQKTKIYHKWKYFFKELSSGLSTILYALLIALILLYIAFSSTYASKIAKENNFNNGADAIRFFIRQDLNNSK